MASSDAPIGVRYKIRLEVSVMQRIMPILPITDLRNQAKEVLSQAQHEPVVITQNGRPSAVLINYALYNQLVERIQKLEAERQAERAEWSRMSEAALMRVWDNPLDAVYDDWRALYGTQTR
jgi:prevent-host-death family protein